MATKKTLTTTSGLDPNIELVGGNGGIDAPATYAGDETSQTFRTMAGKSYCLTLTTGNLTVAGHDAPEYTPDGITLLNASEAGQYIFIAISSYTTVNVDLNTQYVLTPLDFKVASLGASSGGGGSFDPTSNQTITGMWSFSNIVVPTPNRGDQAANKGYVDSKIAAGTSNLVTLTTAQTISGTKSFTGSIVMNNEAPLVLGTGANALKLHEDGTRLAYVFEGGNSTHIDFSVSTSFQDPVTYFDNVTVTSGAVLAIGSDQNALAFRADTTGRTIAGGGPSTVWEINVNMEIGAPVTFRGNAEFTAGATRTTKANPVNTDLLNKEMGDAMYAKLSLLEYVKARAFANTSTNTSFVISDLPEASNMNIKLTPRRETFNEGAKIQIPQAIVQRLQIAVTQSDGTIKYEDPTLVGTNLEITPKAGMSIEMTCLCSASSATVCTCVGFNDYDVMGDAYFLSAIV